MPTVPNEPDSDNSTRESIPRTRVEILDTAPLTMRRPLALIGDHAYAAIWPYVKTWHPANKDDENDPVDLDSVVKRQICIVRSDGTVYGGGKHSLSDLPFKIVLKEIPPDDRLWSPQSAKAFGKTELIDPCEVFTQVVDVVDRFIDFDRSLAPQHTMSELVACCILSTWFLEAFNVIGFLWPNGESGSGKTQLLTLVAELSYLGQLILAGGSFASLRDLADYGATLCFDDAENLADPKRSDPDKRTLLLAGNRRGNTVTVKEPDGDRGWQTRYINTFCLRGFSAITLPDRILASRSIVIPLVRTPDSHRADADPADYALWPHDRRSLVDNLWSMALANLPDLRGYERKVKQGAILTGRNLEPWQASLAVAAWLQDCGMNDLYDRLERLSVMCQSDRHKVNSDDVVPLVIRALCQCLNCDVVTLCDPCDVTQESISNEKTLVLTEHISNAAKDIVNEDELDIELSKLDRQRIGGLMRKLRFEHGDEGGTHRKGWRVSKREVARYALAYGLAHKSPVTDTRYSPVTTVTEGHNVTKQEAPIHAVESDCLDDANSLAWQAQAGF